MKGKEDAKTWSSAKDFEVEGIGWIEKYQEVDILVWVGQEVGYTLS